MKERSQKRTFAEDVTIMALAPLCTQILAIILMPIVTRLYAPDIYGVFHLFSSIVMPISVFVTMGYACSIVLPRKNETASNMLCVSLALTVLVAVLTILFVWFGSEQLLRWLNAPELSAYLWLIPISVFSYGLYISLRFWNVRGKRFGRIAISRISYASVNKGFIISAGFSGFATPGSLIIGGIASSLTMGGVLGRGIWRENRQLFKRSIRWHNLIQGIKRYRKFPIYNLWTDLLSRLSASIVIYLFSFFFNKSVIGYYGLGLLVLNIPMTFIGSSIGEVFYQRSARARYENTNAALVERLFQQMMWLVMLPFLVLAIMGDSIFGFVFGADWSEAGVYAQILSFKIFVTFITNPALNLATILEKQEISLALCIATTITSFISITVGGWLNNVYVALCLLSLLDGLVLLGFSLLMIHHVGLSLLRILSMFFKCFVSCVPVILAIAVAKWCFNASSLLLIIISAGGCAIYYGLLVKEDKVLQSTIMTILRKARPVEKNRNTQVEMT